VGPRTVLVKVKVKVKVKVNLSLCFFPTGHHAMKALMEVSGQLHAPVALPPGEKTPGTHWIEGWVGPRGGLDAVVLSIIV
jgi:hypothetical protein